MLYYVYEYRPCHTFTSTKRLISVEESPADAERSANQADLLDNDSKEFSYAIIATPDGYTNGEYDDE